VQKIGRAPPIVISWDKSSTCPTYSSIIFIVFRSQDGFPICSGRQKEHDSHRQSLHSNMVHRRKDVVRAVCIAVLLPLVSPFVTTKAPFLKPTPSTSRTGLFLTPEQGSIVTVECSLQPEGDFVPEPLFDGIVMNDSGPAERLTFVLGEGNYLPGLHDLVSTMKEGQQDENVSMDAGWGAWNPNFKVSMSLESLQGSGLDSSLIEPGVELMMANGMKAVVTEVSEDAFVVDANPPLAGASYLANVKLVSVEPGPNDLGYSPDAGSDIKYQVVTVALGMCRVFASMNPSSYLLTKSSIRLLLGN
jgi:FKBP-type peptidyl-prolyl cis-trans isomerase 2